MMPGGPQPAERRVRVTPNERTHHLTSTAGSMHRCREGGRTDERVLVDLAAAAPRHPADVVDEHRRVHQLELSGRRCRRLHPQTPRPAGPLERRLDRVDPLRRIRMLRQEHPRVMLTGRAVMEIQHLTHTTPLPHITPLARQHTDQHTSVSNASAAVRITAAVTYPPAERDADPNAWIHAQRGSSLGPGRASDRPVGRERDSNRPDVGQVVS